MARKPVTGVTLNARKNTGTRRNPAPVPVNLPRPRVRARLGVGGSKKPQGSPCPCRTLNYTVPSINKGLSMIYSHRRWDTYVMGGLIAVCLFIEGRCRFCLFLRCTRHKGPDALQYCAKPLTECTTAYINVGCEPRSAVCRLLCD